MSKKTIKELARFFYGCLVFALTFMLLSKIALLLVFDESDTSTGLLGRNASPLYLFLIGAGIYLIVFPLEILICKVKKAYSDYLYRTLDRPTLPQLWHEILHGEPED